MLQQIATLTQKPQKAIQSTIANQCLFFRKEWINTLERCFYSERARAIVAQRFISFNHHPHHLMKPVVADSPHPSGLVLQEARRLLVAETQLQPHAVSLRQSVQDAEAPAERVVA